MTIRFLRGPSQDLRRSTIDNTKLIEALQQAEVIPLGPATRGTRYRVDSSMIDNEKLISHLVDADGRRTELLAQEIRESAQGVYHGKQSAAPMPTITHPPNGWMRVAAEFIFTKKTVRGVFEPLIADQAYEWSEAVAEGRVWKVRWLTIKYAALFGVGALAQALSALKVIAAVWKSG